MPSAEDVRVQLEKLRDPSTSPGESNKIAADLFAELFDFEDFEADPEDVEDPFLDEDES